MNAFTALKFTTNVYWDSFVGSTCLVRLAVLHVQRPDELWLENQYYEVRSMTSICKLKD